MSPSFSKNILLTIQYDGTHLAGWQDNKGVKTVEKKLKNALMKLLKIEVSLQAVSRTDAKVHALDQKVNFFLTKDFPIKRLPRAINAYLPTDIRVIGAEEKPMTFHPTLDCKTKEYWYYLCLNTHQLPFFRNISWHVHSYLDTSLMKDASQFLLGKHDFSAFCSLLKYRNYKDHICTIEKIEIEALDDNRLKICIQGNRFLYKMVRALVGSLVSVGKGQCTAKELQGILESQDRSKASSTAPAHGLFLANVCYLKNEPK